MRHERRPQSSLATPPVASPLESISVRMIFMVAPLGSRSQPLSFTARIASLPAVVPTSPAAGSESPNALPLIDGRQSPHDLVFFFAAAAAAVAVAHPSGRTGAAEPTAGN